MDVLSFSTIADSINKEVNSKCGLNVSQMRILLFFDKTNNQQISMGSMAQEMNISLSTLSRQLQQAKTHKLIKVVRSEKDTSKHICLNNDGLEKAIELKETLCLIEEKLFSNFTHRRQAEFTKELELIAERSSC